MFTRVHLGCASDSFSLWGQNRREAPDDHGGCSVGDHPGNLDPVSEDNKHVADDIEAAIVVPSSIEEEMMLEAAELEEVEFGKRSQEGAAEG